jgi:hypothetical protein
MAGRYLIENAREAAVGVQVFHVRQRWGAAIWRHRAQTQVLLGRLKYALPGWEEAESRRAADTAGGGQAAAGHTLVAGLVLEASTQAAGVPGTAATWVAPTGTPAARALGVVVAPAVGACVDTTCARTEPASSEIY